MFLESALLFESNWVTLCGISAPIFSILFTLAPIPTVRKISKEKSVGSLPLLPYTSMFINGFCWAVYGYLRNENKLIIPNVIGAALGIFYSYIFIKYCPKNATNLPGTVFHQMQVISFILLFTTLAVSSLPPLKSSKIIGIMAVFFCVLLFASPLAAIRAVLETKSSTSIPLPLTCAITVNCFSWLIVGWFEMNDALIYGPNALGLTFSLIQLLLKIKYPSYRQSETIEREMA